MVRSTTDAAPPEGKTAVVAVCASAANTQGLLHLLRDLTPQSDIALVIVLQHREALDTDGFTKALREAGHHPTPIAHDAALVAGRTYLPDPDVIVGFESGRFQIEPAEQRAGERGTIDSLLVALARDEDGCSVAVILAGTGADGTLGVKAVKEAGGLAFAEETEDSKASELARSNHPAALADAVLPIGRLAERITEGVRQIVSAEAGTSHPETAETAAATSPASPPSCAARPATTSTATSRTRSCAACSAGCRSCRSTDRGLCRGPCATTSERKTSSTTC